MARSSPFEPRLPDDPGVATAESVWFAAPRTVELRRESLPELPRDGVRVRALVSAISHGTEMLVYRGQVPADLELDLPTLQGSFGFPIKYGYASVGRVSDVGVGVGSLQPGDLVFAHHPHQTEYVVPANSVVPLPAGLEPTRGVFLANVETAVNVLLDAHPRFGERAVVFGQGVVGLLATQLLKRAGASLVVAVDPLPLRRDLAGALGADVVLAPEDDVPGELRRLTGGVGVDLAFEASGNPAALNQAIDCLAFQGTVVVCSWYGVKPATLALGGAFHRRRLRLASSQVSSLDPALQPRWDRARRLKLARDLLSGLDLPPLVTHRLPFRAAAEAYALVDRAPEQTVQVVLTYDDV